MSDRDLDSTLSDDDIDAVTRPSGVAHTPARGQPDIEAEIVYLSDVEREQVDWLWQDRIPRGKVTILSGDPGVGKSHVSIALAAAVSRGTALPGQRGGEAAAVLLLTAEDALGDTVRPRLEAAGADLDRIVAIPWIRVNGDEPRLPCVPDDIPILRAEMEWLCPALVIVDPLSAYLSDAVNSYNSHEVRRALSPLTRLAEETRAAVVVVMHLTKSAGARRALMAIQGSGDFGALVRTALLVAPDPEDESRRVLSVAKNNLSPFPPSLAFRITASELGSFVSWEGESSHSAESLVAAARDEERSAMDVAADFLRAQLARGGQLKKDLIDRARKEGIATRTLERAAERLSVVTDRKGFGAEMTVSWSLPSASTPLYPPVGETGRGTGANRLRDNGSAVSPSVLARLDAANAPKPLGETAGSGSRERGDEIPPELEQLEIAAYARRNGL